MRQIKKHRFIVVPLVYIILFFGFIFLQFSGQLYIRKTVDSIRFTGRIARGFDESAPYITSARVSISGLTLSFSERNPLILYTPDDSLALSVKSYEIKGQSIVLLFDNAVTLTVEIKSETTIDITIAIPDDFTQYDRVQIRTSLVSERSININQNSPEIIEFAEGETSYSLVLPPFSEYIQKNDILRIPIVIEQMVLRLSKSTEAFVRIDPFNVLEQLSEMDEGRYNTEIESYINTAYQGWIDTRLNGASGTWNQFTSPPVFSEEIVVSLLSEAWRREGNSSIGAYNQLITRMRSIVRLHQSELSLTSMAFLGYMRDLVPRALLAQQTRIQSLQQRIFAQDIRIIEDFDLIDFIGHLGSEELHARLENFFRFLDPNELFIEHVIYLFEFYTLRDAYPTNTLSWLTPFKTIGEIYLIPKLVQVNGATFIETGINEVNTELSLRAGLSFIRYGKETGDTSISNLGRNLVSAVLQLRNSNNSIPEFLYLGTRNAETSQFHFNPERIYRFLRIDGPWPHFTQITTPDNGKNIWAWSVCALPNSRYEDSALRITIDSPVDRTSYILFANIEVFESMTLFGLDWRNDPGFELYARGRYYDSSLKSLMIKHNDSTKTRAVILYYAEN